MAGMGSFFPDQPQDPQYGTGGYAGPATGQSTIPAQQGIGGAGSVSVSRVQGESGGGTAASSYTAPPPYPGLGSFGRPGMGSFGAGGTRPAAMNVMGGMTGRYPPLQTGGTGGIGQVGAGPAGASPSSNPSLPSRYNRGTFGGAGGRRTLGGDDLSSVMRAQDQAKRLMDRVSFGRGGAQLAPIDLPPKESGATYMSPQQKRTANRTGLGAALGGAAGAMSDLGPTVAGGLARAQAAQAKASDDKGKLAPLTGGGDFGEEPFKGPAEQKADYFSRRGGPPSGTGAPRVDASGTPTNLPNYISPGKISEANKAVQAGQPPPPEAAPDFPRTGAPQWPADSVTNPSAVPGGGTPQPGFVSPGGAPSGGGAMSLPQPGGSPGAGPVAVGGRGGAPTGADLIKAGIGGAQGGALGLGLMEVHGLPQPPSGMPGGPQAGEKPSYGADIEEPDTIARNQAKAPEPDTTPPGDFVKAGGAEEAAARAESQRKDDLLNKVGYGSNIASQEQHDQEQAQFEADYAKRTAAERSPEPTQSYEEERRRANLTAEASNAPLGPENEQPAASQPKAEGAVATKPETGGISGAAVNFLEESPARTGGNVTLGTGPGDATRKTPTGDVPAFPLDLIRPITQAERESVATREQGPGRESSSQELPEGTTGGGGQPYAGGRAGQVGGGGDWGGWVDPKQIADLAAQQEGARTHETAKDMGVKEPGDTKDWYGQEGVPAVREGAGGVERKVSGGSEFTGRRPEELGPPGEAAPTREPAKQWPSGTEKIGSVGKLQIGWNQGNFEKGLEAIRHTPFGSPVTLFSPGVENQGGSTADKILSGIAGRVSWARRAGEGIGEMIGGETGKQIGGWLASPGGKILEQFGVSPDPRFAADTARLDALTDIAGFVGPGEGAALKNWFIGGKRVAGEAAETAARAASKIPEVTKAPPEVTAAPKPSLGTGKFEEVTPGRQAFESARKESLAADVAAGRPKDYLAARDAGMEAARRVEPQAPLPGAERPTQLEGRPAWDQARIPPDETPVLGSQAPAVDTPLEPRTSGGRTASELPREPGLLPEGTYARGEQAPAPTHIVPDELRAPARAQPNFTDVSTNDLRELARTTGREAEAERFIKAQGNGVTTKVPDTFLRSAGEEATHPALYREQGWQAPTAPSIQQFPEQWFQQPKGPGLLPEGYAEPGSPSGRPGRFQGPGLLPEGSMGPAAAPSRTPLFDEALARSREPNIPLEPLNRPPRVTVETPASMRPALQEGIPQPTRLQGEAPRPTGATFETSRGSTYTMNPDGTTIRNRAPDQSGAAFEMQRASDKTYFVSDPNPLGIIQGNMPPGQKIIVAEVGDGRIGIKYTEGPYAGKWMRDTLIETSPTPKEGFHPVELFNGGKDVHFGSEITRIGETSAQFRGEAPRPTGFGDVSQAREAGTGRPATPFTEVRGGTTAERVDSFRQATGREPTAGEMARIEAGYEGTPEFFQRNIDTYRARQQETLGTLRELGEYRNPNAMGETSRWQPKPGLSEADLARFREANIENARLIDSITSQEGRYKITQGLPAEPNAYQQARGEWRSPFTGNVEPTPGAVNAYDAAQGAPPIQRFSPDSALAQMQADRAALADRLANTADIGEAAKMRKQLAQYDKEIAARGGQGGGSPNTPGPGGGGPSSNPPLNAGDAAGAAGKPAGALNTFFGRASAAVPPIVKDIGNLFQGGSTPVSFLTNAPGFGTAGNLLFGGNALAQTGLRAADYARAARAGYQAGGIRGALGGLAREAFIGKTPAETAGRSLSYQWQYTRPQGFQDFMLQNTITAYNYYYGYQTFKRGLNSFISGQPGVDETAQGDRATKVDNTDWQNNAKQKLNAIFGTNFPLTGAPNYPTKTPEQRQAEEQKTKELNQYNQERGLPPVSTRSTFQTQQQKINAINEYYKNQQGQPSPNTPSGSKQTSGGVTGSKLTTSGAPATALRGGSSGIDPSRIPGALWDFLTFNRGSNAVNMAGAIDADTAYMMSSNVLDRLSPSKDVKVRLRDSDAPETSQPYGAQATAITQSRVGERFTVENTGRTSYGRVVGELRSESTGQTLSRDLINRGAAWWFQDPQGQNLSAEQAAAQAKRIGLWAAEHPIPPSQWRKGQR